METHRRAAENAHVAGDSYGEAAKLFENAKHVSLLLTDDERKPFMNLVLRYAVMNDAEASRPEVLEQLRFLVASTRTSSSASQLIRSLKAARDKRLEEGLHPL
jgi:hypothetical protein